jgi:exonuclease SbcD
MRILHTADWHLNARLGRHDRKSDIVARLEEIAAYLDDLAVDVLLVAGDLLHGYARLDALRSAFDDVNRIFKPFLTRGGTMVVLAGNHDHETTFALLRLALDLAHPIDPASTGPRPGGRLYLAGGASCLTLGGGDVQAVQFVLLPYPTPAAYLEDEEVVFGGSDERNRRLQQALVARLDRIRRQLIDPALPAVLSAHLHVRGSTLPNLYDVGEADDVVIESGAIPTNWAYVALGHVHNAQSLPGAPHVRYSGSIERFDFAERDDEKGVVLVDVGATGLADPPAVLPLNATPIYAVDIPDPAADLNALAAGYSERDRALVRYTLTWQPGIDNLEELCRRLDQLFPRWYDRQIRTAGGAPDAPETIGALADVAGTARAYLRDILANHPDRDDVLSLAERYLAILEEVA